MYLFAIARRTNNVAATTGQSTWRCAATFAAPFRIRTMGPASTQPSRLITVRANGQRTWQPKLYEVPLGFVHIRLGLSLSKSCRVVLRHTSECQRVCTIYEHFSHLTRFTVLLPSPSTLAKVPVRHIGRCCIPLGGPHFSAYKDLHHE